MDEDEAAQREAERLAAALKDIGPEVGAGATICARAVEDILGLNESARERFEGANTADWESWERLHGTALCSPWPSTRYLSTRPAFNASREAIASLSAFA
jgi:hypothetical protein